MVLMLYLWIGNVTDRTSTKQKNMLWQTVTHLVEHNVLKLDDPKYKRKEDWRDSIIPNRCILNCVSFRPQPNRFGCEHKKQPTVNPYSLK